MPSQHMRKTLITLILLLSFFSLVFHLSHTLDVDLGWHLRFGQDALSGHFQYNDTYTYTFYGQPWINHEWGGDILFWLFYKNAGYIGLVFLTASAVWSAIFLIQWLFQKKITLIFAIVNLATALVLPYFLSVRITTVAVIFPIILILILEKTVKQSKILWLLPPLLWLWSCLHGSWILGFIIINIYLCANIINEFTGHNSRQWPYFKIVSAQIISALLICINPYGVKLWQEVLSYFSQNYFKQFIVEWMPSYVHPLHFLSLITAIISAVLIIWGFKNKKVKLEHLLLFLALFGAAILYRRNNLYLITICAPILTISLQQIGEKTKMSSFFAIPAVILLLALTLIKTSFANDKFIDQEVLSQSPFPLAAVDFLQQQIGIKTTYIFNEFNWGGYLIWRLPTALVYFDGRGTATWTNPHGEETMMEHYGKIRYKEGGINEIENSPAQWIITKTTLLDLENNQNWEKVYEDKVAVIWKRK